MSNKTNLILDTIILSALLVLENPFMTGVSIHEWLALAFTGTIILHLLLHWDWVVKVGGTFFKKLLHQSRLNFAVDVLFFIALIGCIFSGLMISKSIVPTLGIQLVVGRSWKTVHNLTANSSLILLGVHFALHLKWVISSLDRYVLSPLRHFFSLLRPRSMAVQPVVVEKDK